MTLMKTLLSAALLSLSVVSFAQDDIALGVPGYGGNGCPAGSASVTLSPDAKSLSINIFVVMTDEHNAVAAGDAAEGTDGTVAAAAAAADAISVGAEAVAAISGDFAKLTKDLSRIFVSSILLPISFSCRPIR